MGDVVKLSDYREKKDKKIKPELKQQYLDSLDNSKVKEKYKLTTQDVSIEERIKKIKASIHRINKLMEEVNKQ